jgi:hypothetical protein
MRDQEHERGASLHHHDKHAAHKAGHRPDDPHGVTGPATAEELMSLDPQALDLLGKAMETGFNMLDEAMD